ncbi:MAG: hypothetical protein AAFX92_19115 [Pseudomonadota bacterium]
MSHAPDALLDALIPGDATWPAASAVLADDPVPVPEAARPLVAVASLPPAERTAQLTRFEAEAPAAFAALYHAVADAYYAAPEIAQIIARLADAGPRDSGPFDPALLTGVVAEGRARRRL